MNLEKEHSSFRDPSGFVFRRNGKVFRQVNTDYRKQYEQLMRSGLYDELTREGLLIAHREEDNAYSPLPEKCYKVIAPDHIPFISYPYEWCFEQLKRAALLTLEIQKRALEKGMVLKDASAFNVQFIGYKPIFIDTLSFEIYEEGASWIAYKQFCEHFLAPLALMGYRDARFGKLSRIFLDGVPLDFSSGMLPWTTYLKFSLFSHIHLHAKIQKAYGGRQTKTYRKKLSKKNLLILIDNLKRAVESLRIDLGKTEWGDYYSNTNYSEKSFEDKKNIIISMIESIKPALAWDMGANEGVFSRITSKKNIYTVSFDIDPLAIEKNYRKAARSKDLFLLPLIMDISNPSPALGWNLLERSSLIDRRPADVVIAAALIHHLAIGGNATFDMVAQFFKSIGKSLIIEFIPKEDSQVARLLSSRKDIFNEYTKEHFEKIFSRYFVIKKTVSLQDSKRVLYLMNVYE